MKSLTDYLQKHPKKNLIFDFDETLFTLELPWHLYLDGLVERIQTNLEPKLHEERGIVALEHQVVKKHGEQAKQLINQWAAIFEKEHLVGVTEHHSLTNFVREQHDQYQIFLWTSNMQSTVRPILKHEGLLDFFEKLVAKDDVRMIKPDPDGFSLIRSEDEPLENFLMIGDSDNDEGAAKAAGIDFFRVEHAS